MNGEGNGPENIVLVGFMGSGKSTVGRELHHRLGYPWVDMDHEIERRVGKSVAAIFAQEGEDFFRKKETELLQELAEHREAHHIISTGGGVVMREENRALLKRIGFVVWLDAPFEIIHERTARNRDRPLLRTENPAALIRTMLETREPCYHAASHMKIETAGLDSTEIATGIIESARYFFTRRA